MGTGSVPPPPPSGGSAPAASGPAPVPLGEGALQQLPERLQSVQRPVVLSGTVTGNTPEGLTRVRTQLGEVVLKMPTPLPADRPVTLQIPAGNPPGRAALYTTAPTPAQPAAPPPPLPAGAPPSVVLTLMNALMPTAAVPSTLLPGSVVPALVVAAAPRPPGQPGTGAAAAAAAAPTSGTPAGSPTAPGQTATPAPTPAAPSPSAGQPGAPVQMGGDAAHPGAPSAAAPAPAPPTAPAPVLSQGATVALKILGFTPPGAPPAPAAAPPSGAAAPLLHGTVAGATAQGQPILATPQGMLVLTAQGPLAPGTQVSAELAERAPTAATAVLPDGDPAAREGAALRQVMAALAAIDPELARTLSNSILPQPNRKLGAALTFLLSAVRGGDARGWLGQEAVSALERHGLSPLLKRLEEEFQGWQRQAADPLPGDWRPYPIPMYDGHLLHMLHLHLRHTHGEGGGQDGEGETRGSRFLLDIEMSRFGPLQLDGLVRPQRFDLILRSHAPLPTELRDELVGVFADSVSAVGYAGVLSFQPNARGWVTLARRNASAGLGVTA